VLVLLVEGRSNRQIAEQLFISGKTASVPYLASRAQAATAAARPARTNTSSVRTTGTSPR
jgi:DNA-binding CsgD family transcriptional regulator